MDRAEVRAQPLPEVLVVDVDGVLTDGKLYMGADGEKLFKAFHTRDVRAIREFVYHGVEVYLVSADAWPGGEAFAEKVGAVFIECREKDKLAMQLATRTWWVIGDDAWDVPMLQLADLAFIPGDADYSAFAAMEKHDITVLNRRGGHGCVAELANMMFTA